MNGSERKKVTAKFLKKQKILGLKLFIPSEAGDNDAVKILLKYGREDMKKAK